MFILRFAFWKWFVLVLFLLLTFPIVIVGVLGKMQTYSIDTTPSKPIAIVFGAAAWGRSPSPVYADRLQTAADLYFAKKVSAILVSGDNSEADYNEPGVGKKFLVEKAGVPETAVFLDYAGFRTYDTCARAAAIFDIKEAILVTQDFHLPRAIFLCRRMGIDAVGVTADRRRYDAILWYMVREQVGRWGAFWEGTVFRHPPTVLGTKTPLTLEVESLQM